jgi:hypothetical protein
MVLQKNVYLIKNAAELLDMEVAIMPCKKSVQCVLFFNS